MSHAMGNKTMSVTAAIRQARENIRLVKTTPDGWSLREYDDKRNAWIQGHPRPYHEARAFYAESIVQESTHLVTGWPLHDCMETRDTRGLTIRERVARMVQT